MGLFGLGRDLDLVGARTVRAKPVHGCESGRDHHGDDGHELDEDVEL